MAAMTSRERVARTLARQQPDRVPLYDQFWFEVQADFRRQIGQEFPPGTNWSNANAWSNRHGTLSEYFGMDIVEVAWPDYRLRLVDAKTLEESDEWVLQRDGNWAELRWWKHKMGTPEHVGFGISTPQRWEQVKPLLTASRERIRWNEFWPLYHRARRAERFVCYGTVEPFEMIKDVLGHEMMLMAMLDRPEWIHDIFDTYTNVAIELFHMAEAEGMVCDGAFIYGDIAYKNGPFMSPEHYREFLQPYHKRLFDEFARRNMPVVYHSDGDIRLVLDDLLQAGVCAVNPLENNANMDVRKLAPQYGRRVGFVGNMNVNVLSTNDLDLVREEARSKLEATMPYYGYVCHSDHSIPPGVTLETYQSLLAYVREIGRYD